VPAIDTDELAAQAARLTVDLPGDRDEVNGRILAGRGCTT